MAVYLYLIITIFFMINDGVVVFPKVVRGTQLPTACFLTFSIHIHVQ